MEHVLATGSSGVNSSAASEPLAEGLAAIAGTQPSDPAAEFLAVAELQATGVPDAEVPPHVPGRGAGDTSKSEEELHAILDATLADFDFEGSNAAESAQLWTSAS